LEKVIIPEGAKGIDSYAFSGCKKLKEINFPASLEYIGLEAFKGCSSLSNMDLRNTKILKLENVFNRFSSSDNKVSLELFYAPKNLKKFEGVPDIKIAYFYTREVPGNPFLGNIKELHIPKGSRAGWSHETEYVKKVIDDIQ